MTILHLEWGKLYPCIDSNGEVFIATEYDSFLKKGCGEDTITLFRERIVAKDLDVTSLVRVARPLGFTDWMYACDPRTITGNFTNVLHVSWSIFTGKRECSFAFSNVLRELLDKHGSIA